MSSYSATHMERSCSFLFLKWVITGLFFFIFVFSIKLTVYVQYKFLPMTGFQPWTSGIGSDRSTNCDTTTALEIMFFKAGFGSSLDIETKSRHGFM